MGMALSEIVLDELIKHTDTGNDGTVSLDEFQAMMSGLAHPKVTRWANLINVLKHAVYASGANEKLVAAVQMADIEYVEDGMCGNEDTNSSDGAESVNLTLSIHIRGAKDPLLIKCSKPGHVEAWMEALIKSVSTHLHFKPDPMKLSDEEEADLASWRMRLDNYEVFSPSYVPTILLKEEIDRIIEFLELTNPLYDVNLLVRVYIMGPLYATCQAI